MAISPYIARLRETVGHELLLLPAAAILPTDGEGRILLIRQADSGEWATIGGSVELDESPQDAAVREAAEEAGVETVLTGIRAVLGGPEFRFEYPNGDRVAYVATIFDGRVTAGTPRPDGDETIDAAWFAPDELAALDMSDFTRALFRHCGIRV